MHGVLKKLPVTTMLEGSFRLHVYEQKETHRTWIKKGRTRLQRTKRQVTRPQRNGIVNRPCHRRENCRRIQRSIANDVKYQCAFAGIIA